jgi:hypothetical protein
MGFTRHAASTHARLGVVPASAAIIFSIVLSFAAFALAEQARFQAPSPEHFTKESLTYA